MLAIKYKIHRMKYFSRIPTIFWAFDIVDNAQVNIFMLMYGLYLLVLLWKIFLKEELYHVFLINN